MTNLGKSGLLIFPSAFRSSTLAELMFTTSEPLELIIGHDCDNNAFEAEDHVIYDDE